MSVKLLGHAWETRSVGASRTGPLTEYRNEAIGNFSITPGAARDIDTIADYKLLCAIHQTSSLYRELVICLEDEKSYFNNPDLELATLKEVETAYPSSFVEKQDRILRALYIRNPNVGELVQYKQLEPFMFFSKNRAEMIYLLDLMTRKELIKPQVVWSAVTGPTEPTPFMILEKGWLALEQTLRQENARTVFVAMWFDPSMDAAYSAIHDAVIAIGFEPMRIDAKQHNNEISGEILYEIRKCRFVVADVTNQRHGVYFEAGYAIGRGIPVIWSCRSDDFEHVHFDTRQYNHVVWDDETDLKDKISARMKGTILS
jgi:hypothetical protein